MHSLFAKSAISRKQALFLFFHHRLAVLLVSGEGKVMLFSGFNMILQVHP